MSRKTAAAEIRRRERARQEEQRRAKQEAQQRRIKEERAKRPLSAAIRPDAAFLKLRDRMLEAAGVDPADFPLDKYPELLNGR